MGQCRCIEIFIEAVGVKPLQEEIKRGRILVGKKAADLFHCLFEAFTGGVLVIRRQNRKAGDYILEITPSPKRIFLVAGLRYSPMSALKLSSVRLMK